MATQVYRVVRVQTAAASPVGRLQGLSEEGHDLQIELPVDLVQRVAPGHVLVLNWSIHALPEPLTPAAQPQGAAPTAPLTSPASPRAVDDAFMDLMARVRREPSAASSTPLMATTPPASQARSGPKINDEFNTLLGASQGRGSRDGR